LWKKLGTTGEESYYKSTDTGWTGVNESQGGAYVVLFGRHKEGNPLTKNKEEEEKLLSRPEQRNNWKAPLFVGKVLWGGSAKTPLPLGPLGVSPHTYTPATRLVGISWPVFPMKNNELVQNIGSSNWKTSTTSTSPDFKLQKCRWGSELYTEQKTMTLS